jgi:hypothetical protein
MNNVNSSYKAFIQENYPQYAVYEKVPAHGSAINNVILAPYKSVINKGINFKFIIL